MSSFNKKARHTLNVFFAAVREKSKIFHRDNLWPLVRAAHLELHSTCAACGGDKRIQVHHIIPVHIDPTFELDSNNLITLCMGKEECHLSIGHHGSWKDHNPNVRSDAQNSLISKSKS